MKQCLAIMMLGVLLLVAGCVPAPVYTSQRGGAGRAELPPPSESPGAVRAPGTPAGAANSDEPVESFRVGQTLFGEASYYGPGFHGNLTANGEVYDQNALTCAHKTLPFDTELRVTLLNTRKSIVVRVNDRGPYKKGRIIDLSVEAARRIGMMGQGTGMVSAEILKLGEK